MFEDIFEKEDKEDKEEEETSIGVAPADTEMATNDIAIVLHRSDANSPIININMRLLRILEIHDEYIVTPSGRIPKWAIRQYVKENTGTVYENKDFDMNKVTRILINL